MPTVYIIFDSAKLKLGRAEEHIKTLETNVGEFFKTKPYRLDTEIKSDPGEFIIQARLEDAPPKHLGLLIGDALHNLRSALDHIAFDLAGRPTNENVAREIEFPIFTDRSVYQTQSPKRLVGIAEGAKTIIEGLQPYNRPRLDGAGLPYPLAVLYELSNRDKHRELYITGMALIDGVVGIDRRIVDVAIRYGPFEDGAEIARFFAEPHMQVETRFSFSVTIKLEEPKGAVVADQAL